MKRRAGLGQCWMAVQVDGEGPGWETIQLTHKRLGVSVGSIIAAVKDGRLRLGKRTDVFGYHGFVVQITEVAQLREPTQSGVAPTAREGELNAAAFGRSIGIRGNGAFMALIEGGHVPVIEVMHPVTKRPQWRMRGEDVAAFHATFTTPTVLAAETGMHRNTIIAAISAHGVRPFRPDGLEVGPVYLREDIKPVLRALSSRS